MYRCSYKTPGTRLQWSTLHEWIAAAHRIDRRRCGEARNRALAAHAACLPKSVIEQEQTIETIDAAVDLLKYGRPGFARPPQGCRANHPTTPIIMDLMNRRAVLLRQLDDMPAGDNWTAMHGPEGGA